MKLFIIFAFSSAVLALHLESRASSAGDKRIRMDGDSEPEELPDPLPPRLSLDQVFEITNDVEHGGCTQDQFDKLRNAFEEAMNIADDIIPDAIANFAEGDEEPAVGWMFNYLFGMAGAEKRGDGIPVPGNDILNVGTIDDVMQAITRHSHGIVQYPNRDGSLAKTRLYCNSKWLEFKTAITLEDGAEFELRSLKWNGDLGLLVDVVSGGYVDTLSAPSANDVNFPTDLGACGRTGYAFTVTGLNAITICPLAWGGSFTTATNSYTFGDPLPATIGEIQVIPGETHIDKLGSLSHTILHEYMHLVGRGKQKIPLFKDGIHEDYGFDKCVTLATDPNVGSTLAALENADTYAYLGAALLRSDYDWRDGIAREHGFWARR